MAQQSYKKFVASAATATLVASALIPVASANVTTSAFTDVPNSYKEAVDFVVTNNISAGLTATSYGVNSQIKRVDAAVMIAAAAGMNDKDAPASGFKDVPARAAVAVNSLKAAGVVSGKSTTNFGSQDNITRGEAAIMLQKAFDLKAGDTKNSFTDVKDSYDAAVDALVANKVTNGINKTQFGTGNPIKRGDFAKFLFALKDQIIIGNAVETVTVVNETTTTAKLKVANKDLTAADFKVLVNGEAVTPEKVVSDAKGEVYTITHASLKGSKGIVSVNGKQADFNFVSAVVESVNAINAKQIQVTFSKAMDADSVEDATNYAIKRAGVAAVSLTNNTAATGADAELSADGKTLTITLVNALTTTSWGTTGITEGDTFNVELEELKAADGTKIAEQTVTVKYSDKVAPTFVSAMASGKTKTNTVEVTFSEPVDTSVATATINGAVVAISAGSTPNSVKLTSGSDLLVNTAYNVSLLNFKDFAGNLMTPNPVNTTVTVSSDIAAPVVSSVEVVRDNLLKVTFDKAIQASSLTNNGTVKLLDANLATTNNVSGISAVDASNKAFYVSLSGVNFNAAGNFTGTLVLTDAIKDAAGNALTATTKSVSLSKDVVAPQVANTTFKNVSTYNGIATPNGAIVIKYNEAVTASAAAGAYKVIDTKTGVALATPLTAVTVNPNDSTELVLTLSATGAIAAGSTTYTVVVPTSAVVDKSVSANPSVAGNLTVDVTAGAPTVGDVTAPVITLGAVTAATTTTSGTTIVVNFTEAGSGLDTATVINTNNYRLDGLPLPAGSYVTLAGTAATINIPAGTIAENKAYNLNVNAIKDKAGNTALAFLGSATLKDDIAPELKTTTLNSNGTASLGFSEKVAPVTADAVKDIVVKLNGSDAFMTSTPANSALTLVDGTGSEEGKYILSVKKSVQGQAAVGNTLTVNGATYTTAGPTDVIKFEFIDVDGSQTYNTGDILLKATDTAAITPIAFAADGIYNLNSASTLTVGTKATTAEIKEPAGLQTPVKAGKTITVK